MRNHSIYCVSCGEEITDDVVRYNGAYYCAECFAVEVGGDASDIEALADEFDADVTTTYEALENECACRDDWAYKNYQEEKACW